MNKSKMMRLLDNGLRIDDECLILPFQGRKGHFRLNRTEFNIELEGVMSIEKNASELRIPALIDENESFSMKLVQVESITSRESAKRYLLKSKNHEVFKVNGNFVYECFLQRGDIVDLGHNRFIFKEGQYGKRASYKDEVSAFLDNKLIKYDINVLIEGETGTGKTRLARMIHDKSERCGDFVHINISAFSHSLIESELFGHKKGAFTGAHTDKQGALLEANYGTLFLDEIDSLPLDIQTKLLLFLDSKEVRPVGSNQTIKVDTRLVFAAGKKLKHLVSKNLMRKDFYFRLISGVQVCLPSLYKNTDLVEFVCDDFASKNHIYISRKLLAFYKSILWPGNIRQLLGHLNKKKILSSGNRFEYDEVDRDLLGESDAIETSEFHNVFKPFSEVKREYFLRVFMYYEQNYLLAAKVLKVSPQTLRSALLQPASKE